MTAHQAMQKLVDDISAGRWQRLHLLYATDAVVRHPFVRDKGALLEGREALRRHFEALFSTGVKLRATPIRFVETADPERAVGSFKYHGETGTDDDPFELEACFIWRVRDGLVVEADDYLSPRLAPRA